MTVRSILSMFCGTRIGMVALLLALGMGGLAVSAENDKKSPDKDKVQGTLHTVEARVTSPSGTGAGTNVLAEKQPGEFTIPKGSKGTKLKYKFHDPKSDTTLTKLNGRSVYSVTEHRYMHELDHNPDFDLPPGDYKFVVGGQPGASGTLTYTTVPSKDGDSGTTKRSPKDTTKDTSKDKSKTGTEPGPLHPGGEGKRKVVVHMKTTQINKELPDPIVGEGDGPALLSIKGKAFVLELQVEGKVPGEYVARWEGTLERNRNSLSVKGKTFSSMTVQMNPTGTTLDKATGTFTGKIDGNRLSGTASEQGTTTYSYDPLVRSYRRTIEWSIEGFNN